jgi:4'-phosphopantetheinyl transferase
VDVWVVDLDRGPAGSAALLDTDERRRAEALRSATLRRRFVAARAAQRTILGERLGVAPERVRFGYGARGKPYVDGAVQFSASRSGALALVAVARGFRVGVDLERRRPLDDLAAVARTALSPAELRRWETLPAGERLAAFYRVWTRKEAYLKATGDGIADGLAGVEVGLDDDAVVGAGWIVVDLARGDGWPAIADGWAAALAAERPDVAVRILSRPWGSSG